MIGLKKSNTWFAYQDPMCMLTHVSLNIKILNWCHVIEIEQY